VLKQISVHNESCTISSSKVSKTEQKSGMRDFWKFNTTKYCPGKLEHGHLGHKQKPTGPIRAHVYYEDTLAITSLA